MCTLHRGKKAQQPPSSFLKNVEKNYEAFKGKQHIGFVLSSVRSK